MRTVVPLGILLALAMPTSSFADGLAAKPFGALPAVVSNRKMSDDDKARQITNDFAVCMAKTATKRVEYALGLNSLVASYRALTKIADPDCLVGKELLMPPRLLRGALFRALYIRDFGKAAPTGSPVRIDYAAEAEANHDERDLATATAFGSCIAKLNPEASRAFVMSAVATPEERVAIDSLRPAMGDCLRDGTLKLSRAVLQSIMSEVLYREATPRPSIVAGAR